MSGEQQQNPDWSSSGWPAMFRTVREFDIDKVSDCKEDIDTLLVFAGLYSAVLTTLIVESYQSLQQDKQDVMIDLMERFLMQNYITGPGFFNSTTTVPPAPPPFQPPQWAIRVNVLWFTSLILSLGAASIGMLVKQWLREYLALQYLSHKERLRARQYRHPALEKWKVFEIAATLPLLLQMSLGLFFIGLCFFTSAVHESVRNTTIPVVAAWAFFFVITTIAPLFSPRCPFKTTFLKSTLKAGRRVVAPLTRLAVGTLARWTREVLDMTIWRNAKRYDLRRSVVRTPVVTAAAFFAGPLAIPPPRQHEDESDSPANGSHPLPLPSLLNPPADDWIIFEQSLIEEEVFVKTEQEAAEILLSVDAIVSDDAILPTMLSALQYQRSGHPASIIEFILQVMGRRIGRNIPLRNLTTILDLSSLAEQVWFYLTDSAANTLLQRTYNPLDENSPGWAVDAVLILLAHSGHDLSDFSARVLHKFIAPTKEDKTHTSGRVLGARFSGSVHSREHLRISAPFCRTFDAKHGDRCLQCMMDIYRAILCDDPHHHHGCLTALLESHCEEPMFAERYRETLDDLMTLVTYLITWDVNRSGGWLYGAKEGMWIVMSYRNSFGWNRDALALSMALGLHWSSMFTHIANFVSVHPGGRFSSSEFYVRTFNSYDEKERNTHLAHAIDICRRYLEGKYDEDKTTQLDMVRLCRLYLDVYSSMEATNPLGEEEGNVGHASEGRHLRLTDSWTKLWDECARAIRKYHEVKAWERTVEKQYWHDDTPMRTSALLLQDDKDVAMECLQIISASPKTPLSDDGTESADKYPDDLVEALGLFVSASDASENPRLQALRQPPSRSRKQKRRMKRQDAEEGKNATSGR